MLLALLAQLNPPRSRFGGRRRPVQGGVLQLCAADGAWRVRESHRLTRAQFERFFLTAAGSTRRARYQVVSPWQSRGNPYRKG